MNEPYIGPRPFEWDNKDDAARYFGRGTEADELRFRIQASPILLLYAQSGAGKTSLLNAKLIPTLIDDGFRVLPPIRFRGFGQASNTANLRDDSYVGYIRDYLLALTKDKKRGAAAEAAIPQYILAKLKPSESCASLTELLIPTDNDTQIVVIFDQFEEFLAKAGSATQQAKFFVQVAECAAKSARMRFVFSLKSEALAVFDKQARNIPTAVRSRYYLEKLKIDNAIDAITQPVEQVFGWTFQKTAAQKLIKQLSATRGDANFDAFGTAEGEFIEPVQLQIVCQDLWNRVHETNAADKTITENDIVDISDPLGNYYTNAVNHTAKETGVTAGIIREWIKQNLIFDGRERNRVRRGKDTTAGITNRVPEELESARLIRSEASNGLWYELVHDSFVDAILKSNEKWRVQLSGAELIEQELRDRAQAREPLLNAVELAQARILLERATAGTDELDKLLLQLVERSEEELQRREEELQRRQRESERLERMRHRVWLGTTVASVAITAAILIASGLIWWHNYQTHTLERQHAAMSRAEALGANANQYLRDLRELGTDDFNPALLAAIDGVALCLKEGIYAPPDTVAAMRLAIQRVGSGLNPNNQRQAKQPASASNQMRMPVMGQDFEFIPAFSSPSGKFMVTVEHRKVPVLWDTWTFKGTRMEAVTDDIAGVGFSSDTKKFAIVSTNGSVWTWDLAQNNHHPNATNNKIDKELDIPLDVQTYYKGNQNGVWNDYRQMTLQSFIEAIGLMTRPYSPRERSSFRNLKSQDGSGPFTDEIYGAFEEAKKDPESAKQRLATKLREFNIQNADIGSILSQMYVSSARLKSLKPAFLEAAKDYDRAEALNPTSNVKSKAAALRKLQEGNDFAKTDPAKAKQSYDSAVMLDNSVTSLAPDLLKESPALQQESKMISEVEQLLKRANDLAIKGERVQAKQLYEQAKEKAPNALEKLDPDAEIEKLAPKGPGQNPLRLEASPIPRAGG